MPTDEKAIEYEKRFTSLETEMQHVKGSIQDLTKLTTRKLSQLVKIGIAIVGMLVTATFAAIKAWINTS